MAARLKPCCAQARPCGIASSRHWCSARTSRRPRSSPQPATRLAACIAYSLVLRPAARRTRHLRGDSRPLTIRRFASAWCCSSGRARRLQRFYATFNSRRLARFCGSMASPCQQADSMDWTALSLSPLARPRQPSSCSSRSASGSAARWPSAVSPAKRSSNRSSTVPLVLPPTVLGFYLLVTFGARSPLGELFGSVDGPLARVQFRGAGARVGHREHSVRRAADSARASRAFRPTCGMPPRAAG